MANGLFDDETSDAAGRTDDKHFLWVGRSCWGDLVDGAQRVDCPRVANEWPELRRDVDQPRAIVADAKVCSDVALDLRITAAAAIMLKVRSSRVGMSTPPRPTQSPKQFADRNRWMCC